MEKVSKSHVLAVLKHILRIIISREPMIRTIARNMQSSALQRLPIEILLKKLRSLLSLCGVDTLQYLYKLGLFHNKHIRVLVVNILKQRNIHRHPKVLGIVRQFGKFVNNVYVRGLYESLSHFLNYLQL